MDSEEEERKTFNSFEKEEQQIYRLEFIEKNSSTLTQLLTEEQLEKIISECETPRSEDDSMNNSIVPLINNVLEAIKRCFLSDNGRPKNIETSFSFCSKKLHINANMESLMRVLSSIDLSPYPELFRQSASKREVTQLYEHIMQINLEHLPENDNADPEEKENKDASFMQRIVYDLKTFEVISISAVFKIVLKSDSPLFPTMYSDLYRKIGKLTETRDKIIYSQFIVAFMVMPKRREMVEVVCCFLFGLVNKKDSPLKFRNLAVVFTPLFFIDESFTVIDANFKEPLEQLRDFLEFFLEHSREIFLL